MRNVLVTGGAGFIGSHLVEALAARGDKITVLDNLSTGSLANLMNVSSRVQGNVVKGDIRSRDCLDAVFDKDKPYELVFHLAAQTSVPVSVKNPKYDLDVNVRGSIDVITRCINQKSKPHFVFASSAAVYGSKVEVPIRETFLCSPESPYGANKLSIEWMLISSKEQGLESSILRFSNVYGPRQTTQGEAGVVAKFIHTVIKGEPITIFGDGEQTRDFVYVKDVVSALVHASDKRLNGVFNVSTNTSTSVNDLVKELSVLDTRAYKTTNLEARPGDILDSLLNNIKLLVSGWEPRTSLQEGLKETYDHYCR